MSERTVVESQLARSSSSGSSSGALAGGGGGFDMNSFVRQLQGEQGALSASFHRPKLCFGSEK
jgi:hypothetical protein